MQTTQNKASRLKRFHKSELPDAAFAELYIRLVQAGRERASFYSGPRMSVPEFVAFVRRPENPFWILSCNEDMAGMVYLTDIAGKAARVHFCFLPLPVLRMDDGIAAPAGLGRFAVASILHDVYVDGIHMMDVLMGITPAWNKAAVKLIGKCGAAMLGVVPSICHSHDSGANLPGVISYYTRETVPEAWTRY